MGKKRWVAVLLTACVLLAGCGKDADFSKYIKKKEIVIDLPKVSSEYTLAVINDVHLWVEDDEISKEQKDHVHERVESFLDGSGKTSAERFAAKMKALAGEKIDGLILNADIVDQMSAANLKYVCNALDLCKTDYMYLRSDHDLAFEWLSMDSENWADIVECGSNYALDEAFYELEYEEFIVLGINSSHESIGEETLGQIKKVFAKGKPIILFSHVPYAFSDMEAYKDIPKADGRYKVWGKTRDCYYVADGPMAEYLEMVTADDSPVVAVFAAHLHGAYEGKINDKITEYVLPPFYEGNIAYITVK